MFSDIIQSISNVPIASILTITMIVLLLVSVVFGFLRGLKKSIFYTVMYVIACVAFFLSLGSLTNTMLYSDISNFGISISGVKVNSLAESIPEVLRVLLSNGNNADLSGMFIEGTESYVLLMSLLTFVVQFVLCIGFFIVFQIAYKLIVWILWLLVGKRIFKVKTVRRPRALKFKTHRHGRMGKKKKDRLLGGVVGLVPGLISVLMLFVPISGIFSIASSITSVENENGVSFGEYLSEDDYNSLKKAVGSYEESFPGQVLNISVAQDGQSLDVWAFDRMISVKIDDREFNVRKDLENIGKFASNMASTGLLDVILSENFT